MLLNSSDPDLNSRINDGETGNPNDFILHNSMRPNGEAFAGDPNARPSLSNGNVALVTEDYVNDGDELLCDQAGSIESWFVPTLQPGDNPDGEAGSGTIRRVLDVYNPTTDSDVPPQPVGTFCSAHWFDFHSDGILAQGFYQAGLRFIDARDPENLSEYGWPTGRLSEVWDDYYVPQRDENGVIVEGAETDVGYTADLVRGVDVLRVDLPGPLPAEPVEEPGGKGKGNGKGGGNGGGNGGGRA